MFVPPVLFALAICVVCVPCATVGSLRMHPWLVVYLLATASAVAAGAVTTIGLLALAVLFGIAWLAHRAAGLARFSLILVFAALAIALSIRAVPGVGQVVSQDAPRIASQHPAFAHGLDVGKASIGLLLFALLVPRVSTLAEARQMWRPTLALGLAGTAVTVGAAIVLGWLRFEPKLPPGAIVFLASNLIFTCIAEESVFRGLLQEGMHRVAERWQHPWMNSGVVALSAVLFGAAHARGGLHYVVLATLGGATNALAYAKARKVEASAITHFTLNAAHFVLFT